MKVIRKIIQIDETLCDGCGQCVPSCAEGALEIVDGKARILADKYCDGLGACMGECPRGALRITERYAEDFDEEAVTELLEQKKRKDSTLSKKTREVVAPCQCPSMQPRNFLDKAGSNESGSALAQWPVQLRLVPPEAPFFKGADLLVAADCAPVAYPLFHRDFLQGKAIVLGCPKLDHRDQAVEKLGAIFKAAGPRSITTAIMEVPCCGAMVGIVDEARKRSGCKINLRTVVIGVGGKVLKDAVM